MKTEAEVRRYMESAADVKRLIHFRLNSNGTWEYLIETPFLSFPKFVVGLYDAETHMTVPLSLSGNLQTAEFAWIEQSTKN